MIIFFDPACYFVMQISLDLIVSELLLFQQCSLLLHLFCMSIDQIFFSLNSYSELTISLFDILLLFLELLLHLLILRKNLESAGHAVELLLQLVGTVEIFHASIAEAFKVLGVIVIDFFELLIHHTVLLLQANDLVILLFVFDFVVLIF